MGQGEGYGMEGEQGPTSLSPALQCVDMAEAEQN
jgi:hypothetical protein